MITDKRLAELNRNGRVETAVFTADKNGYIRSYQLCGSNVTRDELLAYEKRYKNIMVAVVGPHDDADFGRMKQLIRLALNMIEWNRDGEVAAGIGAWSMHQYTYDSDSVMVYSEFSAKLTLAASRYHYKR